MAPDSRIRYSPPSLPDNWISKLEVSDSKHFGPISFEFNPQLNTIIGGRGSGKSTILEYLRWALCDQPYVHHEEEAAELPDFEKRRRSLISGTLRQAQGTVVIHYVRHGVLHRIRREGVTGKVYLKVADQAECEAGEEMIQSLAQIQGYSQKQLSHVGARAEELVRLLKTPIAQDLANNRAQIEAAASNLRQAFERCESRRNLVSQLAAIGLDLASKQEQIRALSEEIRDLPAEQRSDIDAHPFYVEGQRLAANYSSSLEGAFISVSAARTAMERAISELPAVGTERPRELLEFVRGRTSAGLTASVEQLDHIADGISGLREELRTTLQSIQEEIASHRARYEAAASENTVIQQRLESLRSVSDDATRSENERAAVERRLQEIGDAEGDLRTSREQWRAAVEQESLLLEQQATKLTTDSAGDLRVRINRAKDLEFLKRSLMDAARGAAITTPEKFDALIRIVIESGDPISVWLELGEELIGLARVGPQLPVGAELPRMPRLTAAGFIATELRRIATRLNPTAAFQLTLLYAESAPVFEYRTADDTYIPFEEASPGQQATALITLLLNQSAGPLVVDQPEDDLDNSTILSVAERLWSAKEKRQIIFATHNANLVVIGDAELVLNCAYRRPVDSARVHVADEGAIDNPRICDVITSVIEGGEQAFRLRKERYGF